MKKAKFMKKMKPGGEAWNHTFVPTVRMRADKAAHEAYKIFPLFKFPFLVIFAMWYILVDVNNKFKV